MAAPNHQTGWLTPIATRAAFAFFGVFGYELDTTALTETERAEVRDQAAFYKEQRDVLQRGRFVRLRGPLDGDGNTTAWMAVSGDATRAVVGYYRVLSRPAPGADRIRLRGLDPGRDYRVGVWPAIDDGIARLNAHTRRGDDLAATGLLIDVGRHEASDYGDFWSRLFVIEAV